MQVCNRNASGAAVRADCLDLCVEQPHCYRHVAGMGGDAGFADADDPERATESADGRTTTAWLALVAGLIRVIEVRATGALQQVAGGGGDIAQLAGSAGEQGAGEHRIVLSDPRVGSQVGVSYQCSDSQTTLRRGFNPVKSKAIDVDQVRRRLDVQLHQVQQIGAAGNDLRAVDLRRQCRGFGLGLGARIGKGSHALACATSVMASMMLEYAPQRQILPLMRSCNSLAISRGGSVRLGLA